MSILACRCSCADIDTAWHIADVLVQERLAACVDVVPGLRSVSRWQGAIKRADKVPLLIQTACERLEPLTARVASYPYELPELMAVELAGGLPAYLDRVVGTDPPWRLN